MHIMKQRSPLLLSITIILLSLPGCDNDAPVSDILAEGVIYYVEYKLPDGRSGGFTRLNMPEAVPGKNGSWNVDARGRLTRDFLFISRPQQRDIGVQAIPIHQLISVQFGDGGIKQVDENKPAGALPRRSD